MIPVGILASAVRRGSGPGPGPGPASVTLTVPAQPEALAGFPLYVDLATMPAGFWDGLAFDDGRDLRASTLGGQPLPLDVVRCDRGAQTGELFVRCDLSDSAPTEVVLDFGDASRGAVLPTEPAGRNAVWSDYHRVFMLTPAESGGKALDPSEFSLDRTGNLGEFPDEITGTLVKAGTYGNQGLCWDGTHYYLTARERLLKYDAEWNLVAENPNPTGSIPGANHCGDPDVRDGVIYVPVEYFSSVSNWSVMHIARYRADDLSFISATDISAQGHEVSSFAIDPVSGDLYVSSYAHDNNLWVYSLGGEFLRTLDFDSPTGLIQGIAFHRGKIFLSSQAGEVKVLDRDGSNVKSFYWKGPGNLQGLASVGGELLLLSEQGVGGDVYALRRGGTYRAIADRYESWTMGGSASNSSSATNTSRGILSYGSPTSIGSNTHRSTVAIRSGAALGVGIWNSSQSWLNSSGDKMEVGVQRRVHGVHDGTAYRAVYVEGQETRQASAALRPADGPVALFLGRSDNGAAERFAGDISGLCYLREGALSPAWIAAEVANLGAPGDFYAVS